MRHAPGHFRESPHKLRQFVRFLTCIGLLAIGCGKSTDETTVFAIVPSAHSGIAFVNQVENSKELNIFNYRNFYNGGGVAIGDLDNDGLADVYLSSNMGENKLYLNKGNFQFQDITAAAGVGGGKFWSTGVALVDINADGWLDIYVCNAGYRAGEKPENELFINNGLNTDGVVTFTERAREYGLNEDGYTTHAAFFDYDGDGDLDCYILNNSFMPVNTLNNSNNRGLRATDWPVKDFLKGGGDKLLRNDDGKFVDVSEAAGIYGSLIGFGLGVTVGDLNDDGWLDLYISNDFYERDYLYINQGDGTFKEEIEQRMQHMSLASMGADMADLNNDGLPEIFTTEMLPSDEIRLKTSTQFENYSIYALKQQQGFYHQYMHNCLQLNGRAPDGRAGVFREIAHYAGLAASDWSWGALMFDADNDGWRDVFVCNGIYKDLIDQDFIDFFADDIIQKMAITGKKEEIETIIDKMPSTPIPNKAFRNRGDLRFEDMGERWGLQLPSFSNGAAYGDLDNDGDLDLVINTVNMEALIYRNQSELQKPKHHSLSVQLRGKGQNTYAIGAKVLIYRENEVLAAEQIPYRGFQSSVDYKLVFGLGSNAQIDSLVVRWPDRTHSTIVSPAANQLLLIDHSKIKSVPYTAPSGTRFTQPNSPRFEAIISPFQQHLENPFVDFYPEGLAYRMVSREGPKAATGDVDGDGLEDIFIGGAAGQAGQLYRQTNTGFVLTKQQAFLADSSFEDTAAIFFDADGDGDLDLFVGSGGNEYEVGARPLLDRLYLNDGTGQFSLDPNALSTNGYNTAVAVALDFDADGDLDLFVGSRSVPGAYAIPPRHFLYENDGKGRFKDVAKSLAAEIKTVGMITDALLVDVAGDSSKELVLVGEWMPPLIFQVGKDGLKKVKSDLEQYAGWWYAVATADLDGDGDQDLILGNRGENFYFSGSQNAPAKIWVWDFDGNGTVEKIMTRHVAGRDMTILLKKELSGQMPGMKKQNLKHADFARKSIQELFPADILNKAMMRESTYFKSAVALNDGGGKFRIVELPRAVQFSCVKAVSVQDLDGDGLPDLILGGNDAHFMPQFSKLDASFGHVLLNRGQGQFDLCTHADSGFWLEGDVKQFVPLSVKRENWLIALINGQKPTVFKYRAGTGR